MSAFEKLPREVRDLIYEICLVHEGEIIPFPRDYERIGMDRWLESPNSYVAYAGRGRKRKDGPDPFVGYPNAKRDARQTEKKPCIALLGVNSTIREEAAIILFGKNVWRLSSMPYVQDERYRLWQTYATYFRHIVTAFDARDMDGAKLLDIEMRETAGGEGDSEDYDHFDPRGSLITHHEKVGLLREDFRAKRGILQQMALKSLSMDFSRLYCSRGCCRHEALLCCLVGLESGGPWYRLEREGDGDLQGEPKTDVKILGVKGKKEKKLFLDIWGLKVD